MCKCDDSDTINHRASLSLDRAEQLMTGCRGIATTRKGRRRLGNPAPGTPTIMNGHSKPPDLLYLGIGRPVDQSGVNLGRIRGKTRVETHASHLELF